jgi:hypothetical protein
MPDAHSALWHAQNKTADPKPDGHPVGRFLRPELPSGKGSAVRVEWIPLSDGKAVMRANRGETVLTNDSTDQGGGKPVMVAANGGIEYNDKRPDKAVPRFGRYYR